jgi:hypothetical protein
VSRNHLRSLAQAPRRLEGATSGDTVARRGQRRETRSWTPAFLRLGRNKRFATADHTARFPGESRGPPLRGTSGGQVGPGFRRDSAPHVGFIASRVGDTGGELSGNPRTDKFVVPTQAGTQGKQLKSWVPAFAGTTSRARVADTRNWITASAGATTAAVR